MKKFFTVIVIVILFACFFRFDPIDTTGAITYFYDRWTHKVIMVDNDSIPWAGGN